MKAGFARVEITPGKPMHMAGYDRRQGYSKGCLDPLYVSVVVIGGEVPKFAICSFDLLGVDTAFCDELRQFIENHTFLQGKHVMICATHTHSGPSGIFCNRKNYGSGYADQLLHSGLKAARNAIDDFSETVVSSIPLTVKGVASIRNLGRQQKAQSYEMDAGVLLFSRKKENIRICTFACHPTVLDEQNLFFSRDLPGSAASFMEDGKNTIFLNGPCADLSTRYTRQGSNSEELHRLGKLWGDAVNEI
ncbi:MAG TPA: hypothetical protein DIW17_04940, partial [Clostridiales bacterium]|nr:hypothetical protein [Clostridiales bacterium]